MKKAIYVLLLLIMLVSLCACSSEAPTGTTSGSDTTTSTETMPSHSSPITTNPLITEPVVTLPPVTDPCATEPPVTEPPVTKPPVTEPPTTEPPTTEPPTTEPPVIQPPATEPPKNNDSELQSKYEAAIELLEYYYYDTDLTAVGTTFYSMPEINDDLRDAYTLFVELGDYKDAKDYVDNFVVVPDVLISVLCSRKNLGSGHSSLEFQDTYHYNPDGSILSKLDEYGGITVYTCDKDGKITQSSAKDLFIGGIYHYYYDDNNMLTKIVNAETQIIKEEYSYEYNTHRQVTQKQHTAYDKYGSYHYITQYEYDEKGTIARETETKFIGDDVIIYSSEYAYHDNGYVITKCCIEGDEYEKEYYTETEYTYGTYYYYPSTYEQD